MEKIPTLMIEKISLEIEDKNNIMYEILKEITPRKYMDNNIKPNSNIYFYTLPELNKKIQEDNKKDSNNMGELLSPLNIYNKRIINEKSNVKNKSVKLSQDDHYFFIPTRKETKEINHKLFWSELDLYLFRKNYMTSNRQNTSSI